jgi:hypothetical protein
MGWLDITDDLTKKGRTLPVGKVLIFTDKKGIKTYVKIMRKYKGKIWGKLNYLYHPDEVQIKGRVEDD